MGTGPEEKIKGDFYVHILFEVYNECVNVYLVLEEKLEKLQIVAVKAL